jgi:prepilin-type N-terminal cleavage/methylation domain-containing protein
VSHDAPGEHGFSLVEVLVAMLLIATTAAGVGELCAIAAASTRAARNHTWATWLAGDKVEQLRALTWAFAANGLPVSDTTTDLSMQPATSSGSGLSPSPAGSLARSVSGYVDYLDGSGLWVGAGLTLPSRAVYVRRWSIEPLPANPADTLILQVLVTTVSRDRARQMAPAGQFLRLPDDALVVSVRTRTGR